MVLLSSWSDVNMGALQGLLLRSDQTDSVISELVQKLMNGMSTWESDEVRAIFSVVTGTVPHLPVPHGTGT